MMRHGVMHGFEALNQGHFQSLVSRACWLQRLDDVLDEVIDPQVKAQCRVAGFTEGVLTVAVRDGAWLTTLRFAEPTWIPLLRDFALLRGLTAIRWRVVPSLPMPVLPQVSVASARVMPKDAREGLVALGESLSHEKLSAALVRCGRDPEGV